MKKPDDRQSELILEMRSISKYYGSNLVLDDVTFTLKRGEIHALLGENGAGKTTLMNILRGMTHLTQGEIVIDGKPVSIQSPVDSSRCGIGMVHQHFLLVPAFTVMENLVLSGQQNGVLLHQSRILTKAEGIARRLGWSIPFDARVSDLTVGIQQRVEILKALLTDAKIVLFDEPTAVLTPIEVDDLLAVIRTLRDEGRSIVFVSHKLGEVMALCDRVTVLRRGKMVGIVPVSETNPGDLAYRMIGEDVAVQKIQKVRRVHPTDIAGLKVHNLFAPKSRNDEVALSNLNFEIPPGQILGFAGVDGNGQEELFEVLAGIRKFKADNLTVYGEKLETFGPADLARLRISLIPPDRQRQGLALTMSIRDNLLLNSVGNKNNRRWGLLQNRKLDKTAQLLRQGYDIRANDLSLPAASLSGGNQQKIVIARALSSKPGIVIAASPTRGLDVAATGYVHEQLRKCRDDGAAVVLISTELDEIIALSDNVAVLYEGRIISIVPPTISRQNLGLLMGGKLVQTSANAETS